MTSAKATPFVVALSLCALLGFSGCQKSHEALGGGSHAVPHPRVLLEKAQSGQADSTAASNVQVAGYGSFKGRIVVQGQKSPPAKFDRTNIKDSDAAICKYEDIPVDQLQIGPSGGLANAFVYLSKVPPGTKPEQLKPPDAKVAFDQKTCTFIPHALIVRVGQTLTVLNDDGLAHNTHTFPERNESFNNTVKPNDRDGIPLTYKRPEKTPVRVVCDIHAWMQAWHLPVDHPFAALSANDGEFSISDLPAGTHEFIVWHEKFQSGTKVKITITPDQTTEQNIEIPAQSLALETPDNVPTVVLSFNR